jgi:hypothetical protein
MPTYVGGLAGLSKNYQFFDSPLLFLDRNISNYCTNAAIIYVPYFPASKNLAGNNRVAKSYN